MIYPIYSIIYFFILLFLLPIEYFKRPSDIRKRWLKERVGVFEDSSEINKKNTIWIHAVSVGEVISAEAFIKKLNALYPDFNIILSTVTDTGQKVAKERLSNIAQIIYVPFDLSFCVKKTIDYFKPSLMIIMETELWPNIIRECKKKLIPVILINGRISEKSFKGYKRLGFFMHDILKNIDKFCMQNELYAERIKKLGAMPAKICVTGNFKFDTKPPSEPPEWTKFLKGRVIVAGSTHYPEEDIILNTYIKLMSIFPDLILILAPRHPERFKEVEELVKNKALRYIKKTDLRHNSAPLSGSIVIILDVIGELASTYGCCEIAIIGGSFIKHGGQNPLEPAYWSKGIICGPSMENFPFIEEFYKENGALKTDKENLYIAIYELLQNKEKLIYMGREAIRLYEKNAGATDKVLEIITRYCYPQSS